MKADITAFFDKTTCTVTYVVADPAGGACAIIDPVLDYDAKSGRTGTVGADDVLAFIADSGLRPEWILETHAHADHITAAQYLRGELGQGVKLGIGAAIPNVQKTFAKIFNTEPDFATDGSQWDHLFPDGGSVSLGDLTILALLTPGHTPACVCYRIGDAVFTGDTIFMPDMGSGRCDFPGGSATALYTSVQRILALPTETRIFVGHDYGPGGRAFAWESTVAQQRAENIHLRDETERQAFVSMREARDGELDFPNLILPAVQLNIRAGHLPPAEDNGLSYVKIPLNAL